MWTHILKQFERLDNKINIDICVIGAGLSGLFCAWLLNNIGFNVIVYEANDRIGGRVHSINKNGIYIEEGGEFIGLNHHLWLALANHFSLKLSNVEPELNSSIVLNGQRLSNEEIEIVQNEVSKIQQKISDDASRIKYPSQPWKENTEIQKLDYISIADKFDEWEITGNARELLSFILSNDNAASIKEQSYLGLLCQVKAGNLDPYDFWHDVESFTCSFGNTSLIDNLSKNLYIKLNSAIKSIVYHDKKINFTIANNTYVADYVVLTAPPSVWDQIEFDSTLDISKYIPKMGSAIKLINGVTTKLCNSNGLSSTIGQIWEVNQKQKEQDQSAYLSLFSGGPHVQKKDILLRGIDEIFNGEFILNLIDSDLIDWSEIPYIQTGYSYAGLGEATTVRKSLYYPVTSYNNQLIFAGEHTSADFYGFMEGALQSGCRAAMQIITQVNETHTINI